MKKILIIALLFVAFLSACDPNENIFITRDDYVGTWSCTDNEVLITKQVYDVIIELDQDNSSMIIIRNFSNAGNTNHIHAVVASKNFTFESQTIAGETVYGDGKLISNNRIECTYTKSDAADNYNCTAIFTK
jgi:hypothetical protein